MVTVVRAAADIASDGSLQLLGRGCAMPAAACGNAGRRRRRRCGSRGAGPCDIHHHRGRPPSLAAVSLREILEDKDFSDKDPRPFNFRRAWSSGDHDVVAAATYAGNWSSAEFWSFV